MTSDEKADALVTLLKRAIAGDLIDADLYPLSRRVMVLKKILGKLRPEPAQGSGIA